MFLRQITILLLCAMGIYSCNRAPNTSADYTIKCESVDTDIFISDSVKNVDFIVLRSDDRHLVGDIDKVIIYEDNIYIGDYTTQAVYIYDLLGNFISVIDHHGRGPGEYVNIQNFIVSDNNVYIYDFYLNKILIYNSINSSFLYELNLPFNISDFELLSNGDFLFACTPSVGDPNIDPDLRYRLIITDSQLKIKNKYLKYKNKEYDAFIFNNPLSPYEDKVLYASSSKDRYYILSRINGNIEETIDIEFSKSVPHSKRSDITYFENENYSYQCDAPIMCQQYIAFKFVNGEFGSEHFYHTQNQVNMSNISDSASNMVFGVVGSYQNCFISDWGGSETYKYAVSAGFNRASSDEEALILADIPYIVLYYMK